MILKQVIKDWRGNEILDDSPFARNCAYSMFTFCTDIWSTRNSVSLRARFPAPPSRSLFWRGYRYRCEFKRPHLRLLTRQYDRSRVRCRSGAAIGIRPGREMSARNWPQPVCMVLCTHGQDRSADNIWVTDKGSDVVKFTPEGRVSMVFGRKQEASDDGTGPLKEGHPPLPPEDGLFRP